MNPKIKQLEALYWAGKLGSFQAAANRLHTTQSAISKRIAELESDLGRQLFDRSRRSAHLTAVGERVSAGAEELLTVASRILDNLSGADKQETSIRIGATELVAATWLPVLLKELQQEYPRLAIEVEVRNGNLLLEQMNQKRYDVAILPGPMWGRIYESVRLQTMDRRWMASPSMGISRRVLSVEELSRYPIATQFAGTIHAQLQSAWFKRAGFPQRNFIQADSFSVVAKMAIEGLAVAHLSLAYYRRELELKRLVTLRVEPELPAAEYFAIYRRGEGTTLAGHVAGRARQLCSFERRNATADVD